MWPFSKKEKTSQAPHTLFPDGVSALENSSSPHFSFSPLTAPLSDPQSPPSHEDGSSDSFATGLLVGEILGNCSSNGLSDSGSCADSSLSGADASCFNSSSDCSGGDS
jgi:hypothetical protein